MTFPAALNSQMSTSIRQAKDDQSEILIIEPAGRFYTVIRITRACKRQIKLGGWTPKIFLR
jgi:hypothetical protein